MVFPKKEDERKESEILMVLVAPSHPQMILDLRSRYSPRRARPTALDAILTAPRRRCSQSAPRNRCHAPPTTLQLKVPHLIAVQDPWEPMASPSREER